MTIHYFIPDWDDRVDPNYDFLTDQHTVGRQPYRDDRYAHELYGTAPYDGILVSRAVLDDNPTKRSMIQETGRVHTYLRLPQDRPYQVMGDCGAFSYWKQANPPYETADMLDYYADAGFDLGVSIDHLIFTDDATERERRWHLTRDNAREFLRLYRQRAYRFTPIGVAQGWDPPSYQRAVRELIAMGYHHIAIGGLARSPNKQIIQVLTAVQQVLQPRIAVHLFGVSRPEQTPLFMQLGITSFDSASRLRKAWTDDRKNYYLDEQAFTALRIRDAHRVAKEQGVDAATAIQQEQAALTTLRAYDRGAATLQETFAALLAYAELSGSLTERMQEEYRRTLRAKPWQHCPCSICQQIGVEVIIFRGNNRNRRRGFHNTWQLYQQLQRIHAGQGSNHE